MDCLADKWLNINLLKIELELIMKILADEKHFSKERLEEMRKEAINNVRRTRGKVRLDDLFERKDYKSL